MKKISIVIPAHNEERNLPLVLDAIPREELHRRGYTLDVLVVDNSSVDNTAPIAREKGVQVVSEPRLGKGRALKCAFTSLDPESVYVVMLDGDNSHKAHEIKRLLEPLESGFADGINGSRLGGQEQNGSMSTLHRIANWFFTFLVRHLYRANITDVCSGFVAWRREALDSISPLLVSDGFAIETEMVIKASRMGFRIYSVPITCEPRLRGTSKISPFRDMYRILSTIIRNLGWYPPSHQ